MQPINSVNMPSGYRVNPINRQDLAFKGEGKARHDEMFNESEIDKRRQLYESYNRAVEIANLKDQQLLSIAKADANRDDKYKFGTYAAALVGVPVADTFIRGAFTSGKLSGRLGAMGKTAAGWAGAFALATLYNGLVDKVTAVTPVLKKAEDRHPVMSTFLRLAGFAAVLVGAHKGVHKLATILPKKFPGVSKDIKKYGTKIAKKIDNSALSTKVLAPLKEKVVAYAQKNPKTASALVSGAALSVPFLAFGTLFKAVTDKTEKAEKIQDNYNQLVNARNMHRAELDYINSGIFARNLQAAIAEANGTEQFNQIA